MVSGLLNCELNKTVLPLVVSIWCFVRETQDNILHLLTSPKTFTLLLALNKNKIKCLNTSQMSPYKNVHFCEFLPTRAEWQGRTGSTSPPETTKTLGENTSVIFNTQEARQPKSVRPERGETEGGSFPIGTCRECPAAHSWIPQPPGNRRTSVFVTFQSLWQSTIT